ncbi:hypothetical protein AVEN_75330-1 [Araneus ventricosus]|uniref:Uncharacterized protein n=1 Tax=Araneus ventricosus TaxID=182803 RepID=A0A4Y2I0K4_ARAVE|nr:hypothetical protein AVEN_75330-1 [Araneus ventricosus]
MRTWYSSESRTQRGVKPHIGASPSSLNIRGLNGHMQYSLSELWQMQTITKYSRTKWPHAIFPVGVMANAGDHHRSTRRENA